MDAANAKAEPLEPSGTVHYIIEGGVPLHGEVRISGAKNAVSKLMMASLLTEDRCTIRNAPPNLGDVTITERVLQSLGAATEWLEPDIVALQTGAITNTVVPLELGRKNRLAVLTVGPMLHRVGHAVIPAPGGDRIGPRPINYHLAGLQQMGAIVEERDGLYHFTTHGLKGATI